MRDQYRCQNWFAKISQTHEASDWTLLYRAFFSSGYGARQKGPYTSDSKQLQCVATDGVFGMGVLPVLFTVVKVREADRYRGTTVQTVQRGNVLPR